MGDHINKRTLTFPALLILLAVVLAFTASAGGAHKPRNGVVQQGSSHVSSLTFVVQTLTGLEPGRRVEQTFSFTPDGSAHAVYYGGNAQTVGDDGVTYAFDQFQFVNPNHLTGTLCGWWREPGSRADAEPIQMEDGPAKICLTIP